MHPTPAPSPMPISAVALARVATVDPATTRWPICRHRIGVSRRRIDHGLPSSGADRPPSPPIRGGSTTVSPHPGRIDHRQRRLERATMNVERILRFEAPVLIPPEAAVGQHHLAAAIGGA